MKVWTPIALIIAVLAGCTTTVNPPWYTVTEVAGNPMITPNDALPVEGGWEFRFPTPYHLQKVTIDFEGSITQLTVSTKKAGAWKSIKAVDIHAASPLELSLDVTTNAIRLFPHPPKSGQLVSCRFYIGETQKLFSIPLEKPPFIK